MEAALIEPEEETPEGLGDDSDASWGDFPIDTMLIRNENRTVHDVLRRIEKGSFVMDPDFQREFIWKEDKQSKLIESVLMRIPLPVFYLAEDDDGRMVVVDGLQRLSTFVRFVSNELTLKLPEQPDLNKKRFQDLSAKFQNRIEDTNLVLYIMDAKVPERARLDIFERVNGGVALSRQQMRNCLFMGAATRFLKTEAGTDLFSLATGQSLTTRMMRDREFVNRFCAFKLIALDHYHGDMDEFLARALKIMNTMDEAGFDALSTHFQNTLQNNYTVFGKHAFRKHHADQSERNVLNASLWDVMTILLAPYDRVAVEAKREEIQAAFYALLADEEFNASISLGTNGVKAVRYRFGKAETLFKELFHA